MRAECGLSADGWKFFAASVAEGLHICLEATLPGRSGQAQAYLSTFKVISKVLRVSKELMFFVPLFFPLLSAQS